MEQKNIIELTLELLLFRVCPATAVPTQASAPHQATRALEGKNFYLETKGTG
jgi:hypothetical protein